MSDNPETTLLEHDQERALFRESLLGWKHDSGLTNIAIPVYADLDGDGVADYYALDGADDLVIVSETQIESGEYELPPVQGDGSTADETAVF